MNISNKDYANLVNRKSPPSPKVKDFILAFFVGGGICCLGQLLLNIYLKFNLNQTSARGLVSASLIFLAALLTAIGFFDDIAKHAGAGTLVPITGFANAMVSPAIEYRKEGFILGLGANMFKIAGPVIVYGTVAGTVYGVIYYFLNLLK